jgi:hypothetical protein
MAGLMKRRAEHVQLVIDEGILPAYFEEQKKFKIPFFFYTTNLKNSTRSIPNSKVASKVTKILHDATQPRGPDGTGSDGLIAQLVEMDVLEMFCAEMGELTREGGEQLRQIVERPEHDPARQQTIATVGRAMSTLGNILKAGQRAADPKAENKNAYAARVREQAQGTGNLQCISDALSSLRSSPSTQACEGGEGTSAIAAVAADLLRAYFPEHPPNIIKS